MNRARTALLGLLALVCACAGSPTREPARERFFQYELAPSPPGDEWPACRHADDRPGCGEVLALSDRAGRLRPVCCWQCESGRNACDASYWPGRPVPAEGARTVQHRCATAGPGDLEGDGEDALRVYLDWLVRTYGEQAQLQPRDVELVIARGTPEPGAIGVTAGEVACARDGERPAFRITLYREALVGRRLHVTYNALAHEFEHVLQIRRDGLPCGPRNDAERQRYEQAAAAVADRLMPACR